MLYSMVEKLKAHKLDPKRNEREEGGWQVGREGGKQEGRHEERKGRNKGDNGREGNGGLRDRGRERKSEREYRGGTIREERDKKKKRNERLRGDEGTKRLKGEKEYADYSLIAFDERLTFWLQRVRSLPCACAYVALFARRLAYNHYAFAHTYNATNTHPQGSDLVR